MTFMAKVRSAAKKLLRRPTDLELKYRDYQSVVAAEVAWGRSGNLRLMPDDMWLRVSENCNLKCIGCYLPGRFKKQYLGVEEARILLSSEGEFKQISLTTNEAFLSPHLPEILALCREMHPNAKIFIITNGHIPAKGRYRKAIEMTDRLGLSCDGATKETFEKIRIGGNFERFLANVDDIVCIREETGQPKELVFAFTATTVNLHELPAMMRLAHDHGVPEIWAQGMEAKSEDIFGKIGDILIENMPDERRIQIMDHAQAEAKRLGITFYFSKGLYPDLEPSRKFDDLHVRMCRYPWTQPPQLTKVGEKYVARPCCYILTQDLARLDKRYGLAFDEALPVSEVYNSEPYWKFREDLAAGRTKGICGKCSAAQSFAWNPKAC